MSKHTPKPWQFIGDGLFGGCYSDKLGDHVKYQIHPFYDEDRAQGMHGQRHEADKRLIETAPDLLEILETIVEDTGYGGGGAVLCPQFLDRAQRAIAKAKGETLA